LLPRLFLLLMVVLLIVFLLLPLLLVEMTTKSPATVLANYKNNISSDHDPSSLLFLVRRGGSYKNDPSNSNNNNSNNSKVVQDDLDGNNSTNTNRIFEQLHLHKQQQQKKVLLLQEQEEEGKEEKIWAVAARRALQQEGMKYLNSSSSSYYYETTTSMSLGKVNRNVTVGNPMKGLCSNPGNTRSFWPDEDLPSAFHLIKRGMDEIMINNPDVVGSTNAFDWTVIDEVLEEAEYYRSHVIIRLYIHWPSPDRPLNIPKYLMEDPYKVFRLKHEGEVMPWYGDVNLRKAIQQFIYEFGKRYDGDYRIFAIQGKYSVSTTKTKQKCRNLHCQSSSSLVLVCSI
jgi:hypothetical protein